MGSHGIDVFNGADDHHVAHMVPHHLQLVLLPAQHRLLQHHLGDETGVQPLFGQHGQLFGIVGHSAAGAAQGEAWAHNDGKPDLCGNLFHLLQVLGKAALGDAQVDPVHGVPEQFPVLGLFNGLHRCADHLHIVLVQHPHLGRFHSGVETGLAPQCGQQGIGPLLFDHLGHGLRGDRFDVDPVGRIRIGHDGGGIGVDEHHLIPLLLQGLAGLGAGVIELTGLADNNGTCAND